MNNVEYIYYINQGIIGSDDNNLFKKARDKVCYLRNETIETIKQDKKMYKSVVLNRTCDSLDCSSILMDLPLLNIGDHLLFYNLDISFSTIFNQFQTKKCFYIWKD